MIQNPELRHGVWSAMPPGLTQPLGTSLRQSSPNFQLWLARAETLKGHDILYVGDTETDLKTAQAIGSDVVFVQTDRPRPDLIAQYNPAYAFDDIIGFLGAL